MQSFTFADGSQRRHEGRQGLGDVTVIHVGLVDLELLSCVHGELDRERRDNTDKASLFPTDFFTWKSLTR